MLTRRAPMLKLQRKHKRSEGGENWELDVGCSKLEVGCSKLEVGCWRLY